MTTLWIKELGDMATQVHNQATETYEWCRETLGIFDELSDEEKTKVLMKAVVLKTAFTDADAILNRFIKNIREEDDG